MRPTEEGIAVIRDLNPWWTVRGLVRPEPPAYRRPVVKDLLRRLQNRKGLIELLRGPRQVGKTSGIYQIIKGLMVAGPPATDLLFVRFDPGPLREEVGALRSILAWYVAEIRRRALGRGALSHL